MKIKQKFDDMLRIVLPNEYKKELKFKNSEIPKEVLLKLKDLNNKQKFNIIYSLATGLFDQENLVGVQKELGFHVKDELSGFGVCHKLYNEFERMMLEVHNMEFDLRKNDFLGENLASKINAFVENYSKNLSKKMFEYGIQVGECCGKVHL